MINQDILDDVLNSALQMFRLMAAERGVVYQRLEELKKELIAELSITGELNTKAKVDKFKAKADKLIAKKYNTIQLELDFNQIGQYVADQSASGISIALGVESLKLPTDAYFKSLNSDTMILGAPSSAWWKGQSEDLALRFMQQVRQGLSNAETNQQIISRIVGNSSNVGIMDTARRNAAALVQTSVQTVANDARRATYLANDDIVTGITQVSTLDSHTSLICVSYSGCQWKFDKEEKAYKPFGKNSKPYNGGTPRHWNCRSVEIPITKSWEELGFKNIPKTKLGQRASESGPIAADTTFDGYLQRRGNAYQDEMLGSGRAELWREGKITLRDLVDGNGRPLTLAQLRAKAGMAESKPAQKAPVSANLSPLGKSQFFEQSYLDGLPAKVTQPYNNWEDLSKNAEIGQEQFVSAMNNVAKRMNLEQGGNPEKFTPEMAASDKGYLFIAPLKGYKRALEKVNNDYTDKKGIAHWEQLNDAIRGTISVRKLEDIPIAIQAMRDEGIDFVTRPKDRFLKPVPSGYRDILGLVKLPNGMNAEIQFHVKEMTLAKNYGHIHYETQRSILPKYSPDEKPTERWSKADILAFTNAEREQIRIYGEAWEKVLSRKE